MLLAPPRRGQLWIRACLFLVLTRRPCSLQDGLSQGQVVPCRPRGSVSGAAGYHLLPHTRCRGCDVRRDSSALLLPIPRSVSRESCHQHGVGPPALLLTASPTSSRIIRQSSQPEAHCCYHVPAPTSSLRQLREPGEGIAMIAADSLRFNGAIRQFKQVGVESSAGWPRWDGRGRGVVEASPSRPFGSSLTTFPL